MAKNRYSLVNREGKVLAEIILAKGVTGPEIGRALVASRPLQVVDMSAEADAEANAQRDAEAKKAEAEAEKAKAEAEAAKKKGGAQ